MATVTPSSNTRTPNPANHIKTTSSTAPAPHPVDILKGGRHPEQGRWLASVVRGHCAYYAVPGNRKAVAAFRTQVTRHWHQALRRRSQRTRLDWKRMNRLATRWLPPARVVHPFPDVRFSVRTRGRSPVR